MKRLLKQKIIANVLTVVSLAIIFINGACSIQSRPGPPEEFTLQPVEVKSGDRMQVVLEQSDVFISSHDESEIRVGGTIFEGSSEDILFERDDVLLRLEHSPSRRSSSNPLTLIFILPRDMALDLQIKRGSISIQGSHGELRINSTSADVLAQNISGDLWITTPRGKVTVKNSNAEIHVLAESNQVQLTDLHGDIFATTIMGDVLYQGEPQMNDNIKIETDHAGVLIRLLVGSDVELDLSTAGGQIICSTPGLNTTGRACSQAIGRGSASLSVRTVSGPIRIEEWSLRP